MWTFNLDFGHVIAGLPALIAIIIAAFFAKRDAEEKSEKLNDIHRQGNSFITREMRTRLAGLKAHRMVLYRILGDDLSDEDYRALESIEVEIADLEREIVLRDEEVEGAKGL